MLEKYATPILLKKQFEGRTTGNSVSNVKLTPISKEKFNELLNDYRKKINAI